MALSESASCQRKLSLGVVITFDRTPHHHHTRFDKFIWIIIAFGTICLLAKWKSVTMMPMLNAASGHLRCLCHARRSSLRGCSDFSLLTRWHRVRGSSVSSCNCHKLLHLSDDVLALPQQHQVTSTTALCRHIRPYQAIRRHWRLVASISHFLFFLFSH